MHVNKRRKTKSIRHWLFILTYLLNHLENDLINVGATLSQLANAVASCDNGTGKLTDEVISAFTKATNAHMLFGAARIGTTLTYLICMCDNN